MSVTVAELTAVIHANDKEFRKAAKRCKKKLRALRAEAEAIKKLQPGAVEEVNAVLDAIERLPIIDIDNAQ
jgi:hypothetical protein